MDKIEKFKQAYTVLAKMDTISQIDETDSFTKELLKDNTDEVLHFHFQLLENREVRDLYNRIRFAFGKRPNEIIEPFLFKIIHEEKNELLIADAIQILGKIKSTKILPYAINHIKSPIGDIRYRCIIVIGWIGEKKDVFTLNERLQNEQNDDLRGYASTAMRQMWFRKIVDSSDILPFLYSAIIKEKSEITLGMIIIVIQDLLNRKFGLQEKIDEGIIKGDVIKAKAKIIKTLDL